MNDRQLAPTTPVASGERLQAAGVWLSVLRLVNTLDQGTTLNLESHTLSPDSPGWTEQAAPVPSVIQQVGVPVPANGAIETGVMIVPDPGSTLSIEQGHRVALAPGSDGGPSDRVDSHYATIRNNGSEPTTVSLIYTYQQETFNPGLGDLLGAEMGRLELGAGQEARLGGSISGDLEALPARTVLDLDIAGLQPARLGQAVDDRVDWDAGARLRFRRVSLELDLDWSFDRPTRARQVVWDTPSEAQTVLTDHPREGSLSTFDYTYQPIEWVDPSPSGEGPLSLGANPFGDVSWQFRGRPRVGGELSDWTRPDELGLGNVQLRVGNFGYEPRDRDWWAEEDGDDEPASPWSWGGRERGCLWWFIVGLIVFGGGFLLWLAFGGPDEDVGLESSPTAAVATSTTSTTAARPTTTTTEVITLMDAFIAWGSPTDARMGFMGEAWGWGQNDATRIADLYSMRSGAIRLFFSDLSKKAGKDNAEVKIGSWATFSYQLESDYLVRNFSNTTFECDTMVDGRRTVCASPDAPSEGELLVFISHLEGPIPVDTVTGESYIYGLVFESDGDPSNDYVAQEPYLGDTFQGTDYWYELVGWESEGQRLWTLEVTDINAGEFRGETPSTARAVIWEDMIFWFIPGDEIPAFTGWRFTTFVTDTANPFTSEGSAVDAVPGPPDWGLLDPPTLLVEPSE